MNWRRTARIAFAVVGLATAVTVVVMTRKGPAPPPPPPALKVLDPVATSQMGPGKTFQIGEGKKVLEITFAASLAYPDGRMRWEKAQVLAVEDKSTLSADVVETAGTSPDGLRPKQYKFAGNVVVKSDDGLVVETSTADYDDDSGIVTMPAAVTFHRGRLSGTGVGATYDRTLNSVSLQDQAVAHVAADAEGRGAAEATAKRMSLARGQHSLRLEENARIVGESQTMTGQTATVTFTDDEKAVKYLELRGRAAVTPVDVKSANQPAMNADNITMSLQADGLTLQHATLTGHADLKLREGTFTRSITASWIDLFTGSDGRTLTALDARDQVEVRLPSTSTTPERLIKSALLHATGEDKRGLTSATFEGKPVFEETVAPEKGKGPGTPTKRRATAGILTLALAGKLDAIEQAVFKQDVSFRSDRANATADVATYDEVKKLLLLRQGEKEPRRPSRAETADMTVDAREIDLWLDTDNLDARVDVTTRSIRTAEDERKAQGSLFEGKEPIIGSSDSLEYRRATGRAVYTGSDKAPARLVQGKTNITAKVLTFNESTNSLDATGSVDSTLYMEVIGEKGAKENRKHVVHAEKMSYDDAQHKATYEGAPAVLKTVDGEIEGRKLTFELAETSRALRRLLANGAVWGTLSGGYELDGADLDYGVETDTYVLKGSPARVKVPPRAGAKPAAGGLDCQLATGQTIWLNKATGEMKTEGDVGVPQAMTPISCSTSLRKAK